MKQNNFLPILLALVIVLSSIILIFTDNYEIKLFLIIINIICGILLIIISINQNILIIKKNYDINLLFDLYKKSLYEYIKSGLSLFCIIESIQKFEKNENLKAYYDIGLKQIDDIKHLYNKYNSMDDITLKKEIFTNKNEFFNNFKKINELSELFLKYYQNYLEMNYVKMTETAKLLFYLKSSIPIVADMTYHYNSFSENFVVNLIDEFNKITLDLTDLGNKIKELISETKCMENKEIKMKIDEMLIYANREILKALSKLQHYDITRQEINHLSNFIERLFIDVFNYYSAEKDLSIYITEEEKKDIYFRILKIVDEIITTINEREILHKYEDIYKIKLKERLALKKEEKSDTNTVIF